MSGPAGAPAAYTLRQAEKLVGLTPAFVRSLVDGGVLMPQEGERLTLQDLVVLRTAKALREARVPTRKIVQALRNVQRGLEESGHLASVRVRANGRSVEASDGDGRRDALSGQMLLPLEDAGAGAGGEASPRSVREGGSAAAADPHLHDARHWFQQAVRLEASDTAAAEAAYRRAISLDACFSAAYVNLGAMLCEAKRCHEAVELYDDALDHCGDTPLVHFNRATALEDAGKPAMAIAAYERALELDPALADAHYNLGVLLERLGDAQGSLRHFNAYRRLHRDGGVPETGGG